ncbi:AraC family transcriptional regulator [Steroidobacter flavus]|uniref:AraC family transcriptional regulator n=1 Tax=Steroidobacter flavus TaxID=1842136 RepID=A0ABV8SWB2_9GAMM
MPILSEPPRPDKTGPGQWMDPDAMPGTVFTVGGEMDTPGRFELDFHRHRKAQLLLFLRGVLTCEIDDGFWIVPPHSALWIPGETLHAIKVAGVLEGYVAFIDPAVTAHLPSTCCTLSATPLLRELLIRSASLPELYPEGGLESHLVALLLGEIAAAPVGNLHLPMPTDKRLRKIVDGMMANPADRGTIETWAKRAGLSERTLSRLLAQQTGMSFGRWRQQLSIMLALQGMAKGLSIQQVAANLGYESTASFVTMFRKALGVSPGRYMAERHARSVR